MKGPSPQPGAYGAILPSPLMRDENGDFCGPTLFKKYLQSTVRTAQTVRNGPKTRFWRAFVPMRMDNRVFLSIKNRRRGCNLQGEQMLQRHSKVRVQPLKSAPVIGSSGYPIGRCSRRAAIHEHIGDCRQIRGCF